MAKTDQSRNIRHRRKLQEQGLRKIEAWIPENDADDLKVLATFFNVNISSLAYLLLTKPLTLDDIRDRAKREPTIPLEDLM